LTDVSGDYCTYLTNRFLLIGEKVWVKLLSDFVSL
jgi:hypothetical protein